MKEELKHRQAFEEWVALGEGRSLRKLAKRLPYSIGSFSRWAKAFDWIGRLKKLKGESSEEKSESLIPTHDTDGIKEIESLIEKVSAVIKSCFTYDRKGRKYVPTFEIKTVLDFTRAVDAQKDLILVHRELMGTTGGKDKTPVHNKLADTLNIFMENATDEQKLALLKPVPGVVDERGTDDATGTIQDADYTEIPDGADQKED